MGVVRDALFAALPWLTGFNLIDQDGRIYFPENRVEEGIKKKRGQSVQIWCFLRKISRSYHTALSFIHHWPEPKVKGDWGLWSLFWVALYQIKSLLLQHIAEEQIK